MDQASANNRFMTLIILAALQIHSRCGLEGAYRNLQILVSQESHIALMTSVLDACILKDNIYQKKAIWQKAKGESSVAGGFYKSVFGPQTHFSVVPLPNVGSQTHLLWSPDSGDSPQMILAPLP